MASHCAAHRSPQRQRPPRPIRRRRRTGRGPQPATVGRTEPGCARRHPHRRHHGRGRARLRRRHLPADPAPGREPGSGHRHADRCGGRCREGLRLTLSARLVTPPLAAFGPREGAFGVRGQPAAAASHTHAAGDIGSGTFAIAHIPTGTSGTTVALGNHTHTAASVGAAASVHTHAAGRGWTVNTDTPEEPVTYCWEDTFERPDGAPGSPWVTPALGTGTPVASITSGRLYVTGGSSYQRCWAMPSGVTNNDHEVEIVFQGAPSAMTYFGICLRMNSDGTGAKVLFPSPGDAPRGGVATAATGTTMGAQSAPRPHGRLPDPTPSRCRRRRRS